MNNAGQIGLALGYLTVSIVVGFLVSLPLQPSAICANSQNSAIWSRTAATATAAIASRILEENKVFIKIYIPYFLGIYKLGYQLVLTPIFICFGIG